MLTKNEANRLRELIGRKVVAVMHYHQVPEGADAEQLEAADRQYDCTTEELARYIDSLEVP